MQHFSLPTLQCKLQCKVYIAKCAVLFVISSKRECYFCDQAILFEVKKWVWIIYCKHKPSKASEEDVLVIKCCPQILKKHQLEKNSKKPHLEINIISGIRSPVILTTYDCRRRCRTSLLNLEQQSKPFDLLRSLAAKRDLFPSAISWITKHITWSESHSPSCWLSRLVRDL